MVVGGVDETVDAAEERDANTRNASATQSATNDAADTATQVSDLTDRGSQNGRGFGRGAYGNNNNA